MGFILFSLTDSYIYFLLVFVGLMSLGFRAGYNNALMPAINQWFRRRRGLAMAVAGVGSPLGGIIIAPAVGLLVLEIGWRTTALASGAAILSVVLPLAFFVHRSPESRGMLPDGARPSAEPPARPQPRQGAAAGAFRPSPGEPDFTAREAMKTPAYWLLVLAVGLRNTVHSGMQFLLSPVIVWFLTGSGRPEEDSVRLVGPAGGAAVAEFVGAEPHRRLAGRQLVEAAAERGGDGRRGRCRWPCCSTIAAPCGKPACSWCCWRFRKPPTRWLGRLWATFSDGAAMPPCAGGNTCRIS